MILKSWLDRPSGRRVGELMIITKVTDKRIRATSELPSLSCKKDLRKPIPRKIREIRKDTKAFLLYLYEEQEDVEK